MDSRFPRGALFIGGAVDGAGAGGPIPPLTIYHLSFGLRYWGGGSSLKLLALYNECFFTASSVVVGAA